MSKILLWFNKKIRELIPEKNAASKNHRNNSSNMDLKCCLKYLQGCLNASIELLNTNIIIQ